MRSRPKQVRAPLSVSFLYYFATATHTHTVEAAVAEAKTLHWRHWATVSASDSRSPQSTVGVCPVARAVLLLFFSSCCCCWQCRQSPHATQSARSLPRVESPRIVCAPHSSVQFNWSPAVLVPRPSLRSFSFHFLHFHFTSRAPHSHRREHRAATIAIVPCECVSALLQFCLCIVLCCIFRVLLLLQQLNSCCVLRTYTVHLSITSAK